MGNDFGAFRFGAGNTVPRFPRPTEETRQPEAAQPKNLDPYAKGGEFYKPGSTTASEAESEREKEMENFRVRMAALENELNRAQAAIRDTVADKVKLEAENAKLKLQQPPPRMEQRTREQDDAREYVQQWTNDAQRRRIPADQANLDNTQSTVTRLAQDFRGLAVDPIGKVLKDLGVNIPNTSEPKPERPTTARMHLVPAEEQQIKNFTTQNAQEAQNLTTQAALIATLKQLNADNGGKYQQLIQTITDSARAAAQQLVDNQAQIAKVKALAERFNTVVPIPIIEPEPYGFIRDRMSFDIRNIKDRVPPFDPDKEPNRCFSTIMEDLMAIAEGEYLQEKHWFTMFENILKGEARQEYSTGRKNKWSLTKIVEHLGSLYAHTKTIEDDKRELEAFARKPKEEIGRAMARLRGKIYKLEHLYDAVAFPAIIESRLLSGLYALITPKTKAYLDTESIRATIAGAPFTVETLVRMADIYEKSNNEMPTMPLTCGTNSVELQRKVTQQAALIKSLQKDNTQNVDVNKKLEDILQVASAAYKRERSADKRSSTSSKPAYEQRSKSRDRPLNNGDVTMTDLSNATVAPVTTQATTYPNNQRRADKPEEDRIWKEKQRLKAEYEKKKLQNGGQNPQAQPQAQKQQYPRNGSQDRSRGRSSTPGPSTFNRSGSNTSTRSGTGNSRSNSANGDREAGLTQVTVDVLHRSNYMTCMMCTMKHPPYNEFCPALGNP